MSSNSTLSDLAERARALIARPIRSRQTLMLRERFIFLNLVICTVFSVLVTGAILSVLVSETWRFFASDEVSLADFALGTKWNPLIGKEKHFGIWALISGTLLVTVFAMMIALPLGLITAIYLSEFAPRRVRNFLKPLLEVLAGIPTVVYGFFALTSITPVLQWLHDGFNIYNAMSAGIAVGILCLPTVCSLSEDALRAVPQSIRDASFALGGTEFDSSIKVVLPAALSGIVSAFLLAIARAVGETMIVAVAAGSRARVTFDPREDVQTMTAFMVQMATGDVSNFGIEYYSMYAVAFTLFVLTFCLTTFGTLVRRRFREKYE